MRLSTISSILNSFTSLKGEGISYFGEGRFLGWFSLVGGKDGKIKYMFETKYRMIGVNWIIALFLIIKFTIRVKQCKVGTDNS
jgi:hypothetical protein